MIGAEFIRKLVFTAGILSLYCISLEASLRFEHFSNQQGFNQNTISSIVEDKFGFLWFATPNGLIKYDGYNFHNYTNDPGNLNSITNNNIFCLFADIEGNIWIGTREGVNIYIPSLEQFIKVPLDGNFAVSQILADPTGRIWILGTNSLFTCVLNKHGDSISFTLSGNLLNATSLTVANKLCFINENKALLACYGSLYLIEYDQSLSSQQVKIKQTHDLALFENTDIRAIQRTDNIIWLGTSNGLFKAVLDGDKIQILHQFRLTTWDNRLIPNPDILSIFQDNQKNIWVGSANEGVFKYSDANENFENYGYNPKDVNGISSSRINCFYQDRYNVLWIGTAQGGVNKLYIHQKQFINYSNNPYDNESITGNLINGILEDKKGQLWITNYTSSICRSTAAVNELNAGKLRFERMDKYFSFPNRNVVTAIFEDDRGYIWFGTEASLFIYEPFRKQFIQAELYKDGNLLPLSTIRVISQLDNNHLIIGGESIIILNNPWSEFHSGRKFTINAVGVYNDFGRAQALLKDSKENLWIGTLGGLLKFRFTGNELNLLARFSAGESDSIKLSNNDVFCLHEDNKGNIWTGTFGGGLNKLEIGSQGEVLKIEYFRKNGLLPDDAVYGILQEDAEHLWISTDMGLCRLNIENNRIELFDVRDGLPNNNFRQSAFFKGSSGYFYFGGLNGLTLFKPEIIQMNEIEPATLITEVSVNNNRVKIGEDIFGKVMLTKSLIETSELVVNYKAKILSFHLTAQHSAIPSKNKLRYLLEGFTTEWIETEAGKATITYTNLPAGDYVLKVKSANCDGLWSERSTDLHLKVLPAWYQTWWSLAILLIIIASIVTGIFFYLVNHEKLKQSLIYEQIDKKRIDHINQGRLQFFTNISHEFRTPLTLISGPLERLIMRSKDKEDRKNLSIIQNNTIRLLGLVDQVVTFRQAEQGHLKLNLSIDSLGNFIYPSAEAFEDYAIQKNINFFYKINSPNEEVVLDVEKTERIIFNLLSNSFRFTPAHGNISLEADVIIDSGSKSVIIKAIDTGKGIPPDKKDKIFERFYQVEGRKENIGGTGIGLAFCKSLVDIMGGSISVESEPGVRTCFTVQIPSKSLEDASGNAGSQLQSFIKNWIPSTVTSHDEPDLHREAGKNPVYSILVVEDEAEVRDFMMSTLREKYSVLLAENGSDGMNKAIQHEPDLVISDVMMPEMDGFELCEKLKSHQATCHIPVILLTALGDKENTLKGLGYRADDYISKPFSIKHLEVRIEKLIENNRRLKDYYSKNTGIPDKSIEIPLREREFLRRTNEAIENNLSNSGFGVEELAFEIKLSPSQFYRRLKQLTGQIPNVYLRNYRLRKAAELLRSDKGLNIAEVMYEVGIESNSYFSTSFKKLYGVTPSDFIKNL